MTEEFLKLQKLIEDGKAKISFNRFLVGHPFDLWLEFKHKFLFYTYPVLTSEWLFIPLSIYLSIHFGFKSFWWLILLGIAIPWVIDDLTKKTGYRLLSKCLLENEDLFDSYWRSKSTTIESTKMTTAGESFNAAMAEMYSKKGDKEKAKLLHDLNGSTNEGKNTKHEYEYLNKKESKIFIYPPQNWRMEINRHANDF